MATLLLSTLPQRKFLRNGAEPELDRYGFLAPGQEAFDAVDLFGFPQVLVLAPPWMGKTFVSKQMYAHFSKSIDSISAEAPFGSFFHLVDFEPPYASDGTLPTWWEKWKDSNNRACLIADALDDDARNQGRGAAHILEAVKNLTSQERMRLSLIFFARETDLPKKLEDRLKEIYGGTGDGSGAEYRVVRLAPLDARSAEGLVGTSVFPKIRQLILENRLNAVAGFPAVLQSLARHLDDDVMGAAGIWKQVLTDLIKDKKADTVFRSRQPDVSEQFRAAARVATILTFGDCDAVRTSSEESGQPSIDVLIPPDHARADALNIAGRAVLQSGIFRQSLGGRQFVQRHVQQWLAAFGIEDLPLLRLRPLVTDSSGKVNPEHAGVLALLVKITKDRAVRDWITEQHGGIPPRADTTPWDIHEILAILDRLQALSKSATWGLHFWNDEALSRLSTPGLGKELGKRISNRGLGRHERELLFDVARATAARDAVPSATDVLVNREEDRSIRQAAAILSLSLGNEFELARLGEFAKAATASDSADVNLKTLIAGWLFSRGIWDFATTYREMQNCGTAADSVYWQLSNNLQLGDAKYVLGVFDLEDFLSNLATARDPKSYRLGNQSDLILKSMQIVADQEQIAESDLDLLFPIAVSMDRPEWNNVNRPPVLQACGRTRVGRERLVDALIARTQRGTSFVSWLSRPSLFAVDIDWLLRRAEKYKSDHPWLWWWLLNIAALESTPACDRDRVKSRALQVVPDILQQFNDAAKRAEQTEREIRAQEEELKKQTFAETYQINDIVDHTIANADLSLAQKMDTLSWLCLVGAAFRPTNVLGQWEDLGEERQKLVLSVCASALVSLEPMPVPEGNSYPTKLIHEASCFFRLTQEPQSPLSINAELIRKWLPAAVSFLNEVDDPFLLRCHAAAPEATEDVVLNELRRNGRSSSSSSFLIERLPREFWNNRFSTNTRKIICDKSYSMTTRYNLLAAMVVYAPVEAKPALTTWLESSDNSERLSAIDLWLCIDPDLAWSALEEVVTTQKKHAVLRLRSLIGRHAGLTAVLNGWRASLLQRLAEILLETFPPDSDPVREPMVVYSHTDEDDFRALRASIPKLLLQRGAPEDLASLERLMDRSLEVKNSVNSMRANNAARHILDSLGAVEAPRRAGAIPVAMVARAIDSGVYRIVRTAEDLQCVLLEAIEKIAVDAREHLSLLYSPRKARISDGNPTVQKPLQEDALQAYFYCRLSDRLAGQVLSDATKVILTREALSTGDRRTDIKVQAPTVDGNIVAVVIELKRSTNRDVSTSLRTQLVDQYLTGEGLTHGIYLIGWCGTARWSRSLKPRPAKCDIPNWRSALKSQARAASAENPNVSVEPIIVDLTW